MKKVLILGVNGFIGHHLSKRILETTDWDVYGMDMETDRVGDLLADASAHAFLRGRHHDQQGVGRVPRQEVRRGPAAGGDRHAGDLRASEPLRVFELDFEANLPIVRAAVQVRQAPRLPVDLRGLRHVPRRASSIRTSRTLVYGPINKPRWIYACSKQLMDRVICGYGMEQGSNFTLFRPFNWIGAGPRLDLHAEGRQLARRHAVPRPHRARREHPAGRRRRAEARLHLHRRRHRRADEDHRQQGRHRRRARSTTSAIRPTTTRCASWRT